MNAVMFLWTASCRCIKLLCKPIYLHNRYRPVNMYSCPVCLPVPRHEPAAR